MKRWLRLGWILITNGVFTYFAMGNLQTEWQLRKLLADPAHPSNTWSELASASRYHSWALASVAILTAGVLLEVIGSRAAKFINLGYFSLLCLFWCIATFWLMGNSDPEAHAAVLGNNLVFGGGSFAVLVLDFVLYSEQKRVVQRVS
jgi:hypothetical protein